MRSIEGPVLAVLLAAAWSVAGDVAPGTRAPRSRCWSRRHGGHDERGERRDRRGAVAIDRDKIVEVARRRARDEAPGGGSAGRAARSSCPASSTPTRTCRWCYAGLTNDSPSWTGSSTTFSGHQRPSPGFRPRRHAAGRSNDRVGRGLRRHMPSKTTSPGHPRGPTACSPIRHQFPVADAKTPEEALARAEAFIQKWKDDPLVTPRRHAPTRSRPRAQGRARPRTNNIRSSSILPKRATGQDHPGRTSPRRRSISNR